MKLRHSARTDVGRTRDHNEDDFGVGEGAGVDQYGELLVVCDGMGGHAAGEIASRLGVETILSAYYSDPSPDRVEALRRSFERANERIHAEGRGVMGTTGVAALFYKGMLHVANVGDSRAYLIRNDDICQISRDHSLVGEQVAAGVITADQAKSSYYRNVITRALGYQSDVQVDLFHIPLQVGDTIVLCSDGLHGLVSDEEIRIIARSMPLADAVDRLIDLANERGGTDNITTIIAHVDELDAAAAIVDPSDSARTTIEFPAPTIAETVEFPATVSFAPEFTAPHTAHTAPQHVAPPPAPPPVATPPPRDVPAPRRMNWVGATLASVLFLGLVFVTLFIGYPTALAPGQASPAPTETPPTQPPTITPLPPTQPPTQVPAIIPAVTETAVPTIPPTATATPSPVAISTPTPTLAPAVTATPGASPSTPIATATRTPIPLTLPLRTPTP
ncbi:MAG: Stp1/IreP family PP2C-type Ser/Thr phosphatase [Roseiflexaceae bacterium]|nr:Stp1/IreP family PP2C-type Ser/Thr phosphatase [Roseiflexaceae bacterium]